MTKAECRALIASMSRRAKSRVDDLQRRQQYVYEMITEATERSAPAQLIAGLQRSRLTLICEVDQLSGMLESIQKLSARLSPPPEGN